MPKIRRLDFLPPPDRLDPPPAGVHIWRADLDEPRWPGPEDLPEDERERAERFLRPLSRRRWTASRWALRGVLSRYLGRPPAELRLLVGERGKPRLAEPEAGLAFNVSHSDRLALVAVAAGREVGVDVELIEETRPPVFYEGWTEREARVKCLGIGLTGDPPPVTPGIEVRSLAPGGGFAAAVAAAGAIGTVRGWTFDPTAPDWRNPG
jgi:phosphopantetheinyl transferase